MSVLVRSFRHFDRRRVPGDGDMLPAVQEISLPKSWAVARLSHLAQRGDGDASTAVAALDAGRAVDVAMLLRSFTMEELRAHGYDDAKSEGGARLRKGGNVDDGGPVRRVGLLELHPWRAPVAVDAFITERDHDLLKGWLTEHRPDAVPALDAGRLPVPLFKSFAEAHGWETESYDSVEDARAIAKAESNLAARGDRRGNGAGGAGTGSNTSNGGASTETQMTPEEARQDRFVNRDVADGRRNLASVVVSGGPAVQSRRYECPKCWSEVFRPVAEPETSMNCPRGCGSIVVSNIVTFSSQEPPTRRTVDAGGDVGATVPRNPLSKADDDGLVDFSDGTNKKYRRTPDGKLVAVEDDGDDDDRAQGGDERTRDERDTKLAGGDAANRGRKNTEAAKSIRTGDPFLDRNIARLEEATECLRKSREHREAQRRPFSWQIMK